MENSKIMLVALLVLTLLVGGISGYLMADRRQEPERNCDFNKLMMLKNMTGERSGMERPEFFRGKRMKGQAMDKKGQMFLDIMTKKCKLTDEQQKEIKNVLKANKEELEKVRNTFKDELQSIKSKVDTQIKSVLTEEQKEKFETLKENAKKCNMHQSKAGKKLFKNYVLKREKSSL